MPALLEKVFERPKTKHHEAHKHKTAYKVLSIVSLIALMLQTFPPNALAVRGAVTLHYLRSWIRAHRLSAICPHHRPAHRRRLVRHNRADVLTNGDAFYAAELDAIARARRFVHIECYIFQKGRISRPSCRPWNGGRGRVEVRLVIDAVGSTAFPKKRFERLERAGGRVGMVQPAALV